VADDRPTTATRFPGLGAVAVVGALALVVLGLVGRSRRTDAQETE
jgi:hypothetical protein